MTTLREYWLILILLLAALATVAMSYGETLRQQAERTVVQLRVKQ